MKIKKSTVPPTDEALALARSIIRAGKRHSPQKEEQTLDELFTCVWRDHWDSPKYIESGWAAEVKRLYVNKLKEDFGSLKLSQITASKIRSFQNKNKDTPTSSNRAIEVLSRCFRFAEEKEWRPQGSNPCALIKPFSERKRRRYATPEEIQKISQILEREKEKYPQQVAFIYLLMFSGARPRDIERATWANVKIFDLKGQPYGILSFDGKTFGKTGEEDNIILPPQAISGMQRISHKYNTITGIKMPKKFWSKVRKEAGCPDLWIRDWRRTFATIGLSNGISLGVIGELLNHKSTQTTTIYAKLMNENRMKAATDIADKLSEIMKGDSNGRKESK